MKFPHLTQTGRGQFCALVREALGQSGDRWPVVVHLPNFGYKPEASNEKILENIQMAWYSEQK
jgi:hypothetical protein